MLHWMYFLTIFLSFIKVRLKSHLAVANILQESPMISHYQILWPLLSPLSYLTSEAFWSLSWHSFVTEESNVLSFFFLSDHLLVTHLLWIPVSVFLKAGVSQTFVLGFFCDKLFLGPFILINKFTYLLNTQLSPKSVSVDLSDFLSSRPVGLSGSNRNFYNNGRFFCLFVLHCAIQ